MENSNAQEQPTKMKICTITGWATSPEALFAELQADNPDIKMRYVSGRELPPPKQLDLFPTPHQ